MTDVPFLRRGKHFFKHSSDRAEREMQTILWWRIRWGLAESAMKLSDFCVSASDGNLGFSRREDVFSHLI